MVNKVAELIATESTSANTVTADQVKTSFHIDATTSGQHTFTTGTTGSTGGSGSTVVTNVTINLGASTPGTPFT